MEIFVDYPENRVVVDMVNRKPDVFQFLLMILQSQGVNHTRFRPVPTWFAIAQPQLNIMAQDKTEDLMDMDRFRVALSRINASDWYSRNYTTDAELMQLVDIDTYILARFMVLSCALQLEGVNKSSASSAWQQYKVTWDDTVEQKWEHAGVGSTPEYLYHGSPLANWYSIMRNGLRVTSKTTWMTAGAAFGDGIYCSDTLNVSWGYSGGGGTIIIGVYEVWGAKQYMKVPGYFVIPNAEQLLLRYLIYMPDSSKTNVGSLDRSLHEEWLSKGSRKAEMTRKRNIKVEARLCKEVAAIKDAGIHVSQWDSRNIRVMIGGVAVDINIPHQFPFSSPTFTTKDKSHTVADWTPKSTLAHELLKL